MRLIDANELMEHVWRDKLDSRELIAKMIDNAPTVKVMTREEAIKQQYSDDCISRQAVLDEMSDYNNDLNYTTNELYDRIKLMPPVKPQYTEDEIQKMQDLEQAELEKAYEFGRAEGQESEDSISRQAVNILVDELAGAISDERCFMSRGRSTATIMQDILDLPSVTPHPKTGHWIRWYEQKEYDWGIEHIPHCKCSECGTEYDPHSSQFIKYCCKCSAKMAES